METQSDAPANAEAPALPTAGTVALEVPSAKLSATNSPPKNAGGGGETASVMADAGKNGGITDPLDSPDDTLPPVGGPGGDADMMGDAEEEDDDAPQDDADQDDQADDDVEDAMDEDDEGADGGDSARLTSHFPLTIVALCLSTSTRTDKPELNRRT